jgi:hypothetical protein
LDHAGHAPHVRSALRAPKALLDIVDHVRIGRLSRAVGAAPV